ncbi:MAG TPA: undecaprenyldiphospho-muramoylpentapeptide beta-N-acetylglucosaminyltransferase [Cytophagales bacterium]|nr:undecaprenyldiphospho-muramoylpentapeptide beta-N-acetylglucosaminyltransferase [Cytophagales bacterium]HAA23148.1 undecaprenyldiphospho-muramoylpentapeptide beta-N-acetylglucosaminyltransferase [Cytophagales bacterium]HAP58880.1 undecaprenyldiphospho-muramoylpentapeptide beta-N-acetylglucosaminyltransferase [Cytophagales bacterium]
MISGGGTGGHVYPAIAIANALREQHPDCEIIFVGALGKMEMEKVPQAGYEIIGLNITGIQRKLTLRNLMWPYKLLASLFRAEKVLKQFNPDVVIGVGGYASGPLLYAATRQKRPTLIEEQNSYAGLTNKWLAPRVDKICVAYDGLETFFPKEKLVFTGNPVRQDIVQAEEKRDEALAHFGFTADKKTVLIIGGSLGARTLNEAMVAGLPKLIEQDVQVIWQSGRFYFEEMKTRTEGLDLSQVRLVEFLREMDLAYAAADVVISRAGALSVSEIAIVQKPCILVPSPNVAEDHQTKNARALVSKDAALLVKDVEAKEVLIDGALMLLDNEEKQALLRKNIAPLGKPHAAETIANEVLSLIKR